MAASVRCPYFTAGSRNALMPLLTASTPVIAVQPLAKARSSSQSGSLRWLAGSGRGGDHRRGIAARVERLEYADGEDREEAGDE